MQIYRLVEKEIRANGGTPYPILINQQGESDVTNVDLWKSNTQQLMDNYVDYFGDNPPMIQMPIKWTETALMAKMDELVTENADLAYPVGTSYQDVIDVALAAEPALDQADLNTWTLGPGDFTHFEYRAMIQMELTVNAKLIEYASGYWY